MNYPFRSLNPLIKEKWENLSVEKVRTSKAILFFYKWVYRDWGGMACPKLCSLNTSPTCSVLHEADLWGLQQPGFSCTLASGGIRPTDGPSRNQASSHPTEQLPDIATAMYWSHSQELCTSHPNSVFSNIMLGGWKWPWWEVFTPQKQANTTNQGSSPQPVVKPLPTCHWLYSLTEDHSSHQEPYTAAALSGFRNPLLPLFPSGLGEAVASQDASTSLLGCPYPCPHFVNSRFIKL